MKKRISQKTRILSVALSTAMVLGSVGTAAAPVVTAAGADDADVADSGYDVDVEASEEDYANAGNVFRLEGGGRELVVDDEEDLAATVTDTFATDTDAFATLTDADIDNIEIAGKFGYIPFDPVFQTADLEEDEESLGLESYYRSDCITSVKDQMHSGMCYSFSACATAEANAIKRKFYNTSNIDLCENHLGYFAYHSRTAKDPVGGLAGDNNTFNGNYFDDGGNRFFTQMELSQWIGLANDSVSPFKDMKTSISGSKEYNSSVVRATGSRYCRMSDKTRVKNMIKNYGAVQTAMDASYLSSSSNSYYNASTGAYYQPYKNGTNHEITIVGWNDNFSKSNFMTKPSGNGAWIVKNSWGKSWGKSGYFYVSYYDPMFNYEGNIAMSYIVDKASTYKYNYQYDGGFGDYQLNVDSGDYFANVFTASKKDAEQLKAVTVNFPSESMSYSVQVYRNPKSGNPKSGTPLLKKPITGKVTVAGWYKLAISDKIYLSKGDKFSVVVTCSGSKPAVAVDADEKGNWYNFNVTNKAGQSYAYSSKQNKVFDLYKLYDATARIKAYTNSTSIKIVQRLYNPNSGEHFYTLSIAEKNNLVKAGWKYEGIGWYTLGKGDPVYRMYNKNAGDHHYTKSKAEVNQLKKAGWKYEGIAWYSPTKNKQPLYRLYNPNCRGAGSHHYTTSKAEKNSLVKAGWKYEGIGWYGYKV